MAVLQRRQAVPERISDDMRQLLEGARPPADAAPVTGAVLRLETMRITHTARSEAPPKGLPHSDFSACGRAKAWPVLHTAACQNCGNTSCECLICHVIFR